MKRSSLCSIAALTATLAFAESAFADVYIRLPFVRVEVGGGVRVRVPFVNINVPGGTPVYVMPSAEPAPATETPQTEALSNAPKKTPAKKVQEPAEVKPDDVPPVAQGLPEVLTPEQFTKSFQPKAGNYEVTMLNPVSNQATTVRFTLPEGTPRRVHVSRNQIEFDYGPRKYVRIRFDGDGAEVISR